MDHDLFATINGLAGRERVLDVTSVALSRFGPFLLLVALLPDLVPPRYRCEARTASAACLDCGHWDSEHCSSIRSSFVSGTDHVPSPPRLPIFCRRMILRFQATMQRSPSRSRRGCSSFRSAWAFPPSSSRGSSDWRVSTPVQHYVSDVVGGALIGILATVAVARARHPLEPFLAGVLRLARRLHLA